MPAKTLVKLRLDAATDPEKPERHIAIDPTKVLYVKESVSGWIVVYVNKDTFFEVRGSFDEVLNTINNGRGV